MEIPLFWSQLVQRQSQEPNAGFFPLTVDYRENYYAAGRIPGGFFKREGKPSEKEVLTCRLIDRPIRPLFPSAFLCETQVIALVLSADVENDPDTLSICGASAALFLSDIPFVTPIAGVRVGLVNDQLVINPTNSELKNSRLNLIIAGSEDAIMMVEAGAQEVSEATIVEALNFGHQEIKKIIELQKQLAALVQAKKREVVSPTVDSKLQEEISYRIAEELRDALNTQKYGKIESYSRVDALKENVLDSFPEEPVELREQAAGIFDSLKEKLFREDILEKKHRS